MTETLEADALEKVYKYDVSVEVRNVLGDRLARVFPTVRVCVAEPCLWKHVGDWWDMGSRACLTFGRLPGRLQDVAMWMSRVGFAQCDSTQTIADLQDTIEEKLGIPVHRQRLFYKDMFMDNEDTPIRNLKLMEKRPNMMYVEDQVRCRVSRLELDPSPRSPTCSCPCAPISSFCFISLPPSNSHLWIGWQSASAGSKRWRLLP